jgi:hypothetical protein
VSDFLLNVARRGAGLPAAVSPRQRPPHEEPLLEDAAASTVEAGRVPEAVADPDEPHMPVEPGPSGAVPEPAPPSRAPNRVSVTRMTPERPAETTATPSRPPREERPPVQRTVARAAPRTTVSAEAAPEPAQPTVRAPSLGPRPRPKDVQQEVASTPPPRFTSTPSAVHEPVAEQRPIPAEHPADPATLVPVRVQPATAPALAWPVADPTLVAPHVDVRIGRIEILPAPPAVPLPSAPRRQPRGFAAETSSRSYRDRRWY